MFFLAKQSTRCQKRQTHQLGKPRGTDGSRTCAALEPARRPETSLNVHRPLRNPEYPVQRRRVSDRG